MRAEIVFVGLLLVGATGCQNGRVVPPTAGEVTAIVVDSLVGTLNSSLNDTERSVNFHASATACGINRFLPVLDNASTCNGTVPADTVTLTYNGCKAGASNEATLGGAAQLTFDSLGGCSDYISNAAVPNATIADWTTTSFTRTSAHGSIAVSSQSHTNYKNATLSGGVRTVYGAGSVQLSIRGIRRTGTAYGLRVDHSLQTSAALAVTGSKVDGDRAIAAGDVTLDDNWNEYTATITLTGVTWASANCCYPTSGTLSVSFAGELTGTGSVDFNSGTCGQVSYSTTNSSTTGSNTGTITLLACE